jgi:hypothetical protein
VSVIHSKNYFILEVERRKREGKPPPAPVEIQEKPGARENTHRPSMEICPLSPVTQEADG